MNRSNSWTLSLLSPIARRCAATVLTLAAIGAAHAQDKISFTDSWTWAGFTSYFLLAEKRGYYAQEGLQVSLNRGYGSGKVPSDLAAGTHQIGSGDINPVIVFNAKNPDRKVIAIALIDDISPLVAVVRADGPIKTPKDFEGKTLAAPDIDSGRQFFPVFAKANGFDPNKVKWVSIQGTLRESMLVRGQADGITGFINSTVALLEKLGLPEANLKTFRYQDYGVDLYGRAIMVPKDYAEKNPKAVKGFLRAVYRAMHDVLKDPQLGIAALKEKEPLVDADVELKQWMLQRALIVTDNTRKNGLSAVNWERMQRSIRTVEQVMALSPPQDAKDVYTDAYLPPRTDLRVQ